MKMRFWDMLFIVIAAVSFSAIVLTAIGCREPYLPPMDHPILKEEVKTERDIWRGVFLDRTYRIVYTLDLNKMTMQIQSYDAGILDDDQSRSVILLVKDGLDVIYAFSDEAGKPGFSLSRDAMRFRQSSEQKATLTSSQGMLILNMEKK